MQVGHKRLDIRIHFRSGEKLDLKGAVTAGSESGCYNVVFGDSSGPTSIRRWPLDLIKDITETPVEVKPNPADRLQVVRSTP